MLESRMASGPTEGGSTISEEVIELHERCGVYTRPEMVERILDAVGWTDKADLSDAKLLEPAAGDGAYLVEAARRLLRSPARLEKELSFEALAPRISAFELHAGEASKARARLVEVLEDEGLSSKLAVRVAKSWVRNEDFLLTSLDEGSFSHVVGNPPYARWSKIPEQLRQSYEAELPAHIAKGDIFLPFLDRGIEALRPHSRLGFLCSNRWQFMAFAEQFRRARLPEVKIIENAEVDADDVFQDTVDAYPSVLVLERRKSPTRPPRRKPAGKTIVDLGFEIRVGPALGCMDAFVLQPGESDVEPELLSPFLHASDLKDGTITDAGRRIVCMHGTDGCLLDPADHPLLLNRLRRFEDRLRSRSIVAKHDAPWYRPIDTVQAAKWSKPKLLVRELSKYPQAVLDTSSAVPSHGIYAIMPKTGDADIEALAESLREDGLLKAVDGLAPRVKGGYLRCYKSILERAVIVRG